MAGEQPESAAEVSEPSDQRNALDGAERGLIKDTDPYAGRWIARLGRQIIGQGGTPEQALQAAKASRFKETPQVEYVPTSEPITISPWIEKIRAVLPSDQPAFLVGGAVRDALLQRPVRDMDFAVPRDGLKLARKVADALGGAYYPLDEARGTGRVVFIRPDESRLVIDFAEFQGSDLMGDLRARDFTINAMALDVNQPEKLLDPLGGAADLHAKQLRACSERTFIDDPVRILRGVRLAAAFKLRILPETRRRMRQATDLLPACSAERLRDELMYLLGGARPATSIRALDILGCLEHILPELEALKRVQQSPPHVSDVWGHTLDVLQKFELVLDVLALNYDPDLAASAHMGLLSLRLGRYREQITDFLAEPFTPERNQRPISFLAALYHDIGKPETQQIDETGRIRFFGHPEAGADKLARRASALRLSNAEIAHLKAVVQHHLRPILLAQTGHSPTRRAVYRFFRQSGRAGVDVCLLSLADVLATYGPTLTQDVWAEHLDVVRALLEAYWERPEESVAPPSLITGSDLIAELEITPGPEVGWLLEKIREAQATGRVNNRQEALTFAKRLLDGDAEENE